MSDLVFEILTLLIFFNSFKSYTTVPKILYFLTLIDFNTSQKSSVKINKNKSEQ